jgi:hypothetical protein
LRFTARWDIVAFGFGNGSLEFDEAADKMRALQEETDLFVTDAVVERGIEMLEKYRTTDL